jgi:hypothetical protein
MAALTLPALSATAQDALPARANDEVRASPNALVGQTIGTTNVVITYGRPAVREREIFGALVPYGEVWRTGANEATVFHVSDDVSIQGQRLAAGTYGLFTVPGEDAWTLVFNRTAEQWGAYEYDATQDVLRVEADVMEAPGSTELLTFEFTDVTETTARVVMRWADRAVSFTVDAGE